MIKAIVYGNTYEIKEQLKAKGFRWNGSKRAWFNDYEDADRAKEEIESFAGSGRITEFVEYNSKKTNKPKKYRVKEDWIFNLESMHDKLFVIGEDLREGRLSFPIEIAKKQIKNFDDLEDLKEEAYVLKDKAWNGGLTSTEYGRAKEIVSWRVWVRYNTCLAAGMDEREAGRCFEDM